MNVPALELREVTVRYEPSGPAVLDHVSLSVNPGERVALMGLNGTGKTTLLGAVVGLVPHRGEIFIGGERLEHRTVARIRDRVGFLFNVPEDQILFPRVIDDVAFGLLRRGARREEAMALARHALEDLGIGALADHPVHHLSHGQKQRVALAGVLVTRPELLLLDEPSAGLDPPGRRSLGAILAAQQAAMIIATHDFEFAARFCTRFLIIEGGRVEPTDADSIALRWG